MSCRLEIVSDHRDIVGDDAVREFHESGGTIGRSLQNDWILPDPDRYISARHATIDFKGGIYYLVDTSSNGVYINGDCEPVGKGNVQRLFNGDTLRFGDFEIKVEIDHGESIAMPLDEPESQVGEHVASLVPEDEIADEFGFQIVDVDFSDRHRFGFGAGRFQFLTLADIRGECNDLTIVGLLQPFQDY